MSWVHNPNTILLMKSYFAFSILVLFADAAAGKKKILILPADHNSGILQMVHLANAISEDGHQVVFCTGSKDYKPVEKLNPNISLHEDKNKAHANYILSEVLDGVLQEKPKSIIELLYSGVAGMDAMNTLPKSFLSDPETLADMKSCDLAIILAPELFWSALIIPYKLDIPYIVINARTDPWIQGVASSPAAEPNFGFASLDENSGLLERLMNTFTVVVGNNIAALLIEYRYGHLVSKLAPEKPPKKLSELYSEAGMVFVQQNPVCLDYPRNTMPHYQMVGGYSAQKSGSASNETMKPFHDFLGQSDFVLMTLGSQVKTIPNDKLKIILNTFAKFQNLKFVLRNVGKTENLPKNVLISPWLPQSDLMALPNVKLFITHGGLNGQNEGAYYGVPMLVLAIYGDHWYNGRRANRLGTTEVLDFAKLTESDFTNKLNLMLSQKSYSEKALKCKKILQALPSAKEVSLYWINHVLEFGYDHLQPLTKNMPWYQMLILDQILVVFVCLAIGMTLFLSVMRMLWRCLCARRKRKTE